MEERKHLREMIFFFEIWIFRNGQSDCDDDRFKFCSDDFNIGGT